jgi:5'-deoxynucleotidase YfbR-like HD superfamily hydrolase
MFERLYRELSFVPRWSVARMNRSQNVAEHSYYVVLYALQTAELIKWKSSEYLADLAHDAVIHDLSEVFTGDINGPAKRRLIDKPALENLENKYVPSRFGMWPLPIHKISARMGDIGIPQIIKFADIMDEVMHIHTEIQMGNRSLISHKTSYLDGLYTKNPATISGDINCVMTSSHVRLRAAWEALQPFSNLDRLEFMAKWDTDVVIKISEAHNDMSWQLHMEP